METQIQGYSFSKRDDGPINLFGYATKSMPGLEINGLGKYGKTLKEKIIFITRSRQLPIPLKRFVISSEYELKNNVEELKNLDLPILLIYWYLAGILRVGKLDNCFAAGGITPNGTLFCKSNDKIINHVRKEELVYIGDSVKDDSINIQYLSIKELLCHIPDIKYELETRTY